MSVHEEMYEAIAALPGFTGLPPEAITRAAATLLHYRDSVLAMLAGDEDVSPCAERTVTIFEALGR